MFSIVPTSKLLTTIANSAITLTNILVQFPIVVAYNAALRRR
jgi:hypothetical protein